jgi:rubrerythrin
MSDGTLKFLLALAVAAVVLIAYSWIEKRINQRRCRECGFSRSLDDAKEECPRCGSAM